MTRQDAPGSRIGSGTVVARAPGRVNLIGEHTDTTLGRCLPIAIDRAVVVSYTPDESSGAVVLTSDTEADPVTVGLDVEAPASFEPAWGRYVAGVVQQVRPRVGGVGHVTSTLPAGVGLSSSAALEVACALALGADAGDPVALARLCQAAEHAARGVPTGLLDQLASIAGVAGHAVLLDCRALSFEPVPLPPDDELEIVVVPGGARSLEHSGYADRLADLHRAEAEIGPLRDASLAAVDGIEDGTVRRRARHVVAENARVLDLALCLASGDVAAAGAIVSASHRSLRDDYECSLPRIDDLCAQLDRTPGVLGSRILGAGWGGAVLALTRPGALTGPGAPHVADAVWPVRASAGAAVA
ncbi:MAG: galactokinase family protein [Ilumatobacteraceae bacterium]